MTAEQKRAVAVAKVLRNRGSRQANFGEFEQVVADTATGGALFVIRKGEHVYYVRVQEYY